jgi:hypothetical protein
MKQVSIIQQANAGVRLAFQSFRNDADVIEYYRQFYAIARGNGLDTEFKSIDAFVHLCIDDIAKRHSQGIKY